VEDWTRHGVLALGAASRSACDLRSARKLLTLQQTFQSKPIRLRSIFVPPVPEDWDPSQTRETIHEWTRAIAQRRLAGVLELDVPPPEASPARLELLRQISREAVRQGFVLRMRSDLALNAEMQRLVSDTGSLSATTPGVCRDGTPETLRACCVLILTAGAIVAGNGVSGRQLIDDGWALALSAGYRSGGPGSFNPQYVIHLACRELGMTLAEALNATTWNAACALRMAPVAGSLETGKQADLVVLDLADYRELSSRPGQNDVDTVLRAGRLVYRRNGILGDLAPAREDTRRLAAR
jgi:imidazolonepropionase